jgi:hypothetical protein
MHSREQKKAIDSPLLTEELSTGILRWGKGRPGAWQQKAKNWSQIAKF